MAFWNMLPITLLYNCFVMFCERLSSEVVVGQACPNYSTKGRVAAGFLFNQAAAHQT